ncbi:MAG TPA: SEL1-like repeat protein [Arsenophonus sp.]
MKVAYYYEKGISIKKDLIKAVKLYQMMANNGRLRCNTSWLNSI